MVHLLRDLRSIGFIFRSRQMPRWSLLAPLAGIWKPILLHIVQILRPVEEVDRKGSFG